MLCHFVPSSAGAAPGANGCPEAREERSLAGAWSFLAGPARDGARRVAPDAVPMVVPSNWHLQGVDHAGEAWYWREVRAPAGRWALELGGVDYEAEVFWDGRRLGSHRGYFASFAFLVEARADATHLLAVRVSSPRERDEAWSLRKQLIKGVLGHHDTRPGNAWSPRGQDANTGGMWGEVRLRPVERGRVAAVRTRLRELNGDARVALAVEVEGVERTGSVARWAVLGEDGVRVAEGELGALSAGGPQRLEAEVRIPKALRWWPRELGAQPLYTLEVTLSGRGCGADVARTRFALRTLAHDALGRLLVNGVPFFLRGTNYIGTLYLAQGDRALFERDVLLMEQAHVNAVRVHAHVTAPAFYDVADERGLLVFQDFPLQWGYDDSPAFVADAVRQAREMVRLLDRHPSIVRWTAHNEAPWSSPWMASKYPDWSPDLNRALDTALALALQEEDPTREVEANSSPADHLWLGWYSGRAGDFSKPVTTRWVTEFGAQAVPRLDTLRTFVPPTALWPLEGRNLERWAYHGFQLRELTEIAKVAPGRSVEELVARTQGYQALLLQAACEGLRRQKWLPVAGIFQFMFTEHWPSMTWGVLDHLRMPKEGYAALARGFQPVLPLAAPAGADGKLHLWIVNDRPAPLPDARLEVYATEPGRAARADETWRVDVPANGVLALERTLPAPRGRSLVLRLVAADGARLAENVYAPGYFEAVHGEGAK